MVKLRFINLRDSIWEIQFERFNEPQMEKKWEKQISVNSNKTNKAVYTAALVADGWAGAENFEKELSDLPTE